MKKAAELYYFVDIAGCYYVSPSTVHPRGFGFVSMVEYGEPGAPLPITLRGAKATAFQRANLIDGVHLRSVLVGGENS